jgi:hypothetical protein
MKQFDRFLATQATFHEFLLNDEESLWPKIPKERLCCKEVLGSFATYLATDAKTKPGDQLMANTASGYFGRVKEFLYPLEDLWKLDEKNWFTPLKMVLEDEKSKSSRLKSEES